MNEKTTIYVRGLPLSLIREFKAKCYAKGESMKSTIINLIKQYLEKANFKNGKS